MIKGNIPVLLLSYMDPDSFLRPTCCLIADVAPGQNSLETPGLGYVVCQSLGLFGDPCIQHKLFLDVLESHSGE